MEHHWYGFSMACGSCDSPPNESYQEPRDSIPYLDLHCHVEGLLQPKPMVEASLLARQAQVTDETILGKAWPWPGWALFHSKDSCTTWGLTGGQYCMSSQSPSQVVRDGPSSLVKLRAAAREFPPPPLAKPTRTSQLRTLVLRRLSTGACWCSTGDQEARDRFLFSFSLSGRNKQQWRGRWWDERAVCMD